MDLANRSRSRTRAIALLISCSLVTSGCSMVSLRGGFEPATAPASRPTVQTIRVVVGDDARPLQGRSAVGAGFLAYIPLFPYGHQQMDPGFGVLAGNVEAESYVAEVASVVVDDLQAMGIAGRVMRGNEVLRDLGDQGSALPQDHRLIITLDEAIYHRYMTAYGLSIAGALLWFVGLPTSFGSADLAFTAELRDPSDRILGSRSFEATSGATEWLYRPLQYAYPPAMPRAYTEISPQLRAFVSESLVVDR